MRQIKRQRLETVLLFIDDFIAKKGYPPTIRQISKVYIKYNNTTAWRLGFSNSTNFTSLSREFTSAMVNTISADGKYILYAVSRKNGNTDNGAVSDGTTPAWVEVKDIRLIIELEANGRTIIESFIAANHIENLAAQEEAEAGEDNTKTMTPMRVFQAIAKWTKDKFISMTENETVLGIKNFANGLQVGGRNVLSQKGEIVFDHTSETDSSIQSGIVRFKRYGDWVLVNFNFQCRSTNIASGGNLIGSLEADIVPSGSIQVDVTFDKSLTIDASGKVTALWGLEANKYYAGSAMYFAKNKL